VKLYSRPGNDLTYRFPLIVEAVAKLRSRSCIIDAEAVACGDDGIASFDRIRYRRHDAGVFLYAFDLIELDGDDLRRDPLAVRKATLASLLRRAAPGWHGRLYANRAAEWRLLADNPLRLTQVGTGPVVPLTSLLSLFEFDVFPGPAVSDRGAHRAPRCRLGGRSFELRRSK
jgi:hypothetical protein